MANSCHEFKWIVRSAAIQWIHKRWNGY